MLFCEPNVPLDDALVGRVIEALDDASLLGFLSVVNHDGWVKMSFEQLQRVTDVFLRHNYPTVTLSSHRATLAIVKAVAWSGGKVRCYPGSEITNALAWLGVAPAHHALLIETVEALRVSE